MRAFTNGPDRSPIPRTVLFAGATLVAALFPTFARGQDISQYYAPQETPQSLPIFKSKPRMSEYYNDPGMVIVTRPPMVEANRNDDTLLLIDRHPETLPLEAHGRPFTQRFTKIVQRLYGLGFTVDVDVGREEVMVGLGG